MSDTKDEILLNIMFIGSYLKHNIGHEIINLFQDDNGNNYIYVLPYGTMDKKHNDKIKTILLVKRHNKKDVEIFAKAEGLEQIAYNKTKEKLKQEQEDYITNNNIRYGKIKLDEIFEENLKKNSSYITFKAKKVLRAKKPIYITIDSSNSNNEDRVLMEGLNNFSSSSPKMYISDDHPSYKILQNIINDKSKWGDLNKQIDIDKDASYKSCFMNIIGKGYDELAYSNLFAYFFSIEPKIFCKFAKEILKIDDFNESFEIIRESECNIDLFIKDENYVIVIENKIKSGINGKGDNYESQLEKYHSHVEEKYKNKERRYCIFVPNYNSIYKDKYYCGNEYVLNKYTLIDYERIYKFFEENHPSVDYFDEFLSALKPHTKSVDNQYEEQIHYRFVERIKKVKLLKQQQNQ